MNSKIIVTYSISTPESRENGELSEHGYYDPSNGNMFEEYEGELNITISEAVEFLSGKSFNYSDNYSCSFAYTESEEHDLKTGELIRYTVSFEGFSLGSRDRIKRLLKAIK